MGNQPRDVKVTSGLGGEWVVLGTHMFWFSDHYTTIAKAPICSMHRFEDCFSRLSFSERHAIAHAGED